MTAKAPAPPAPREITVEEMKQAAGGALGTGSGVGKPVMHGASFG